MQTYSYKVVDFGSLSVKVSLEDFLNGLGGEGWDLIAIASPQRGIFRKCEAASSERDVPAIVKAKYRDPDTGLTWSGRGRMATWLAHRVRLGARLDDFLVKEGS